MPEKLGIMYTIHEYKGAYYYESFLYQRYG